MEKQFVRVDGGHLRYRRCGRGPLLFLLHPSPRSGAMLEPLMQGLSPYFTCVAPDLPGYGCSSPLPHPPQSLDDYIPTLQDFFEGFLDDPNDSFQLYGSATGAQLAIAYSLQQPHQVEHLWLDNCAHFTEEQCAHLLQNYFPDLTPQADGTHLQKLWQHLIASTQFFPWFDQLPENRFAPAPPSPAVLQEMLNDYLAAGADYSRAYKLAFLHERADKVQQLKVDTTLFRWAGSPILKYMDQLLTHPLPNNITVVNTSAPQPQRLQEMAEVMQPLLSFN